MAIASPSGKYVFNNPVYVVAHDNCTDGFSAFYVALQAFGADNVVYVSGSYNRNESIDQIPDNSEILFVDFSLRSDDFKSLVGRSDRVVVLDHHETAVQELEPLRDELSTKAHMVLDMNRSGAGIAWDELIGGQRPEIINYVEANDLWRLDSLPACREVGAYLQNVPRTVEAYDKLFDTPLPAIIIEGTGAYKTRMTIAKEASRNAVLGVFEVNGEDIEMPVSNVVYAVGSQSADQMTKDYSYSMAAYFLLDSNNQYRYGFRSRDDFDVEVIAKSYGGGGHKAASGAGPFDEPIHKISDNKLEERIPSEDVEE